MGEIADDWEAQEAAAKEKLDLEAYEQQRIREADWRKGWHTTKKGVRIRIKDMATPHLRNTLYLFAGMDTEPLKKELNSRLSTEEK